MDPIADFLNQIKIAGRAGHDFVVVPQSNIKLEIAKLLEREGYLKAVASKGRKIKKFLSCEIVFEGKKSKIEDIKRISKPSCRVYIKAGEIKPVKEGFGLSVISTPKGLMTDKEAKKEKVGGEVLFNIW